MVGVELHRLLGNSFCRQEFSNRVALRCAVNDYRSASMIGVTSGYNSHIASAGEQRRNPM